MLKIMRWSPVRLARALKGDQRFGGLRVKRRAVVRLSEAALQLIPYIRVAAENQLHGLDSRQFSRIEVLTLAHQCSPWKGRVMASKASPSETLAWWTRAAQARRVAGMLSLRDARLAEAYAVECEDQAREASSGGLRSARLASARSVANPVSISTGRGSPKLLLFCED